MINQKFGNLTIRQIDNAKHRLLRISYKQHKKNFGCFNLRMFDEARRTQRLFTVKT